MISSLVLQLMNDNRIVIKRLIVVSVFFVFIICIYRFILWNNVIGVLLLYILCKFLWMSMKDLSYRLFCQNFLPSFVLKARVFLLADVLGRKYRSFGLFL